jgi:glycosyltransferase involved in cell wall biosynthesis
MLRISVCMIARNEEKLIAQALESVKDADEIIVCDTGSTDSTVEIARRFTDKVFTDFAWCDDFAKARNHAADKAAGDWILSVDADHQILSSMDEVREQAAAAQRAGYSVASVAHEDSTHRRSILWRNTGKITWEGRYHENLNDIRAYDTTLRRRVGWSENHERDPDRALRILLADNSNSARRAFYLGRENWERRNYVMALHWFGKYVPMSKWFPEKSNALYCMARCHWELGEHDAAHSCCLRAIDINANYTDALLMMAQMSKGHNAARWREAAARATNERVLFTINGTIPRVANILRPGAFGDVVMTSAVTAQLKRQGYRVNYYTECTELAALLDGVDAVFPSSEWAERPDGLDVNAGFTFADKDGSRYALDLICKEAGLPAGPMVLRSFDPVCHEPYCTIQSTAGWSSLKEYPHWNEVLSGLGMKAFMLDDSPGWAQSCALIQHAALHLGGDSVCAHIAAAYGVPSVVVFGSTDPKVVGHPTAINLSAGPPKCHPCYIQDRAANGHRRDEVCPIGGCAGLVDPKTVIAAARKLLKRERVSH